MIYEFFMNWSWLALTPLLIVVTTLLLAFNAVFIYGIYDEFKTHGIVSGLLALTIYGTLTGMLLVLIISPWQILVEIMKRCIHA